MNKEQTQIKITKRQQEILYLLYRFRYLDRRQIQALLNQKDHRRVIPWLNEITELKLTTRYFEKTAAANPAVYSLDSEGRKYLKKTNDKINIQSLARLWRDKKYSAQFRNHCLFAVDIYLSLAAFCDKYKSVMNYRTKTELYQMEHMISPEPDSYFSIKDLSGNVVRYFLEIFEDIAPLAMRNRIKQYLHYFDSDEWQDSTGTSFPKIILVCPTTKLKNHLFYYIQNKIDEDSKISFYLTTWETAKQKGLIKEALEKVKPKE